MKEAKSGFMAKHLSNALDYITEPEKTEKGQYVAGWNCIPELALKDMLDTKKHFNKGKDIILLFLFLKEKWMKKRLSR